MNWSWSQRAGKFLLLQTSEEAVLKVRGNARPLRDRAAGRCCEMVYEWSCETRIPLPCKCFIRFYESRCMDLVLRSDSGIKKGRGIAERNAIKDM